MLNLEAIITQARGYILYKAILYKALGQACTLGTTVHSERLLAVSNVCEAAAATAPAKPAATLEAKGCTGPASSIFL